MTNLNALLHGTAREAADTLDASPANQEELRAALINAMRRIDWLERQLATVLAERAKAA